jgi:hypothetical protein
MATYVEVDSDQFKAFLVAQGFSESIAHNEVVFVKRYEAYPELMVKVFTSIKIGEDTARDCGSDAIRVVAVFDNNIKSFGIGKFARVYRTTSQESVHQRTLSRIEEAFARCKEWRDKQVEGRKAEALPVKSKHVVGVVCPPENNCDYVRCQNDRYRREDAEDVRKTFDAIVSNHVGRLGEVIRATVKVIKRFPWSDRFLFTMQDDVGHVLTFWTKKDLLQLNETYDIHGRVKGFNTFRNIKQTELTEVVGKRVVL